jgi:hypothetical protein
MKKFFDINTTYKFEIIDLFTLITILNVTFIILGFWWAPILGLVNCALNIVYNTRYRTHINAYLMQIALIVLNVFFLTL